MTRRLIRRRSFQREGRLIPRRARGLRAASVSLAPGQTMAWHSTGAREELLIALRGMVQLETRRSSLRCQRVVLKAGQCAFLPRQTPHRLINRSNMTARYLYVTGDAT